MWQIIAAAAMAFKGFGDGQGIKRDAKTSAYKESLQSWSDTMLEYKKIERQQEQNLQNAQTRVYASGLQMSGSSERAVESIDYEQTADRERFLREGKQKAKAIKKDGYKNAEALRKQSAWGGIQQGMSMFGGS